MVNSGRIKVLDKIQGASFLTIRAAIGVFQRHNPDVAHYKIEVVREGDSDFVIFAAKDRQFGMRQGTDVELNATEMNALMSNRDRATLVDTIEGSSFLAIQAAMEVFQRHNPDLAYYEIEVVREGDSVVVIFADKNKQKGTRGNIGARPGFEVELGARDLQVRRSNFIR